MPAQHAVDCIDNVLNYAAGCAVLARAIWLSPKTAPETLPVIAPAFPRPAPARGVLELPETVPLRGA